MLIFLVGKGFSILKTFIIECIGLIIAFTLAILIPLCKNPVWWIHDYPKDIQEKYFETHERIPAEPLSGPALVKKSVAILICLGVMVVLVKLAGADNFTQGFLLSYGLWVIVDWYDCFILDWVLFANIKRIRLEGTEHMDEAYHQKKYHFVQSCIGMILGLLPSLLCGMIIAIM